MTFYGHFAIAPYVHKWPWLGMKRVLRVFRFILYVVPMLAILIVVTTFIAGLIGGAGTASGSGAGVMSFVALSVIISAWQFTADKPDMTKEGIAARREKEAKEEQMNSYSPEDY